MKPGKRLDTFMWDCMHRTKAEMPGGTVDLNGAKIDVVRIVHVFRTPRLQPTVVRQELQNP